MKYNRLIQLIASLVAVIALVVAGLVVTPTLQEQREELQLVGSRDVSTEVPATVAFTSTMMGPFRPMLVNMLWYRIERLKQEGKFFEINELSNWITTLQPHFPKVWAFHAWNMAYNVSVQTYTEEERWAWVNKGIRLLRERGLKYNPRSVALYRELTWIFFHKVGQYSDDVHWYYKMRLCRDWQEILGSYAEGKTTQQVMTEFMQIVDAADTVVQLREADSDVDRIIKEFIEPAGYKIEGGQAGTKHENREKLLRELGKIIMYSYAYTLEDLPLTVREQQTYYDSKLVPIMQDEKLRPAVKKLLSTLRKRVLIDNYNMKPADMHALMLELNAPLDFRHPSVHAMYWSSVGIREMQTAIKDGHFDRVNTLRQTHHAAQDLVDTGRLIFDPINNNFDQKPDVRFIEVYHDAWKMARKELAENERGDNLPYKTGHENLLLKSFVYSMLYGSKEKAVEYRNTAARLYANERHNKESGRYLMTDYELMKKEYAQLAPNMETASQFLDAMVGHAIGALVEGKNRDYQKYVGYATNAYKTYQAEMFATAIAGRDRMKLRPLKQVFAESFFRILISPLPVEKRSRAWNVADLELRKMVYAQVKLRLDRDAKAAGMDPLAAFPPPLGMENLKPGDPKAGPGKTGGTKPPFAIPLKPPTGPTS
jgi:hypothetical protein